MNLTIDCPHCHKPITAPEDVEVQCPYCKGRIIAERPVLRAQPKKRQPPITLAGGIVIALLPFAATWLMYMVDQQSLNAREEHESRRVEYRVSGDGSKALITYTKPGGTIEQHETLRLPWSHEFTAVNGSYVSLSAQNQNGYGEIDVTILVNGITVKGARSSASYGIASAHATVP